MVKISILLLGDKITCYGLFLSANINFGVGLEKIVKNRLEKN